MLVKCVGEEHSIISHFGLRFLASQRDLCKWSLGDTMRLGGMKLGPFFSKISEAIVKSQSVGLCLHACLVASVVSDSL